MPVKYDLIVVGAGPAGLLAAKAAGLAGLRVALLERKPDITRLDRMCGQTLVSVNDYYFDDLVYYNREQRHIGFVKNGFSFAYDGPAQNCYAWHIYSPDGTCLPFGLPQATRQRGDYGPVGIAVDKEVLFGCLLGEVQAAGVEVFTGIDVSEVSVTASGVQARGADIGFEGSYLIAADGTNSRISRMCGFNAARTFYSYLLSRGGYMASLRLPEPDVLISSITYTTAAPGFMFIFPRPHADQHTVAFLSLDPRADLEAVARSFMHDNPFFSKWFTNARQITQLASAQYIFSPVHEPYKDRVLLAGDTGACQELENTGAMISGWKAGSAIAAAVREDKVGIAARGIAEYVQWWQETYVRKCSHEAYLMNFALPYVIDSAEDLNYLFGLVREPLPPCWNPYAAIVHMGQLMQRLVPVIQKERPAFMQKLARMSSPMTEVLQETTRACQPVMDLH